MTPEEAKQLKPGDCVLVEAFVAVGFNGQVQFGKRDNLFIVLGRNGENGTIIYDRNLVRCEDIREKLTPPRRKFRKGDILLSRNGYIYFAVDDEDENGEVGVDYSEDSDAAYFVEAENLTLMLAVENRKDRKEGV